MNTSQLAASTGLSAIGALHNNGFLAFYNGTMPATPETALSGNTKLGQVVYSATAFGAPSWVSPNMQAAAAFTGNGNPVANGGATFARRPEHRGGRSGHQLRHQEPGGLQVQLQGGHRAVGAAAGQLGGYRGLRAEP